MALALSACSRSDEAAPSTLPELETFATSSSTTSPATPSTESTQATSEEEPPTDATPDTEAPAPTLSPPPPLVLPDSVPDLPGRLIIAAPSGELVVVDDGTIEIAVPAAEGVRVAQPTWAPDGSLAYTHRESSRSEVVVLDPNGAERSRIETTVAPFYLHWSPDSQLIGMLGPGGEGVELGVGSVADGSFAALSSSVAYFFDWSPDSRLVVSHAAPSRLVTVDMAGVETALEPAPGAFQAPEFTPGGDAVILAVRVDSEQDSDGQSASAGRLTRIGQLAQGPGVPQEIISLDLASGVATTLLEYVTQTAFDLSPDGTRLAYTLSPTAGQSFIGPLLVVDLATGRTTPVTDEPVLGFEWSPDSSAVAYISANRDNELHWGVWQDGTLTTYAPQAPTALFFLEYLPFWSQYARSLTLWAPDSSAFVYPVQADGGDQEIWVQPLDADEPTFVSPGSFAGWSR